MNQLKNFLSFVEIKTKLCSFIPFFIGIAYTFYQYRTDNFNLLYTCIFLAAMFLFDMATTAINNLIGAREAITRKHYSEFTGLTIIILFILSATALGILITVKFGIVVLIAGAICFFVGIFYTFGPISISRTPYGEILSGTVQGFFITFLVLYINTLNNTFVSFKFSERFWENVVIDVNILNVVKLIIITIPSIICIANIMLANNICDVDKDVAVKRYTLPYYLGLKISLKVFSILYHLVFIVILLSIFLKILPWTCIIILCLYPIIFKNIKSFKANQSKSQTFILSVKNFVLIGTSYTALLLIGSLF